MSFLPITTEEVGDLPLDIVLITGEAYCDHPSFGHAIVSRLVQHMGLSIAIISQPQCDSDYQRFGMPKMGFMISGGVVDSMVNNYTVAKIKRTDDVYSEGGVPGRRPDRCVDIYCRTLKKLYPSSPIIIGGIEASLRRFAHYDYWADKVLPTILQSSGADLLIYGMGEKPIMEICRLALRGVPLDRIRDIRGTCYMDSYDSLSIKLRRDIDAGEASFCPSYEAVSRDRLEYVTAFNAQSANSDPLGAKILLQKHGEKYLVQNLPQLPCSEDELGEVYSLPYMRDYHPSYTAGVPAIKEVKYSITSHRGCFGGCNYCALTYHQGKIIQKRSKESIIAEAEGMVGDKDFKGYIHDIGGPTANFRNVACDKQLKSGVCAKKQCIGYNTCDNLKVSHSEYMDLLRDLRAIKGIKKVFIRSGIRYDYLMYDSQCTSIMKELITHHISGQLKVAPEHVSDSVLKVMNKPNFEVYKNFKLRYDDINKKVGKEQFLVPYLISSHPGAGLKEAIKVAEYLKSINYMPEQVQDFYPTPSTKSTCMYYTGINPDTMQEVYVPRSKEEKRMQRALLQYRKKENYNIIKDALKLAGRQDLIGFTDNCLIKPTHEEALKSAKDRQLSQHVPRANANSRSDTGKRSSGGKAARPRQKKHK